VETLVVEQRLDKKLLGCRKVDQRGEQPLLFLAEMPNVLHGEEAEEARSRGASRGCITVGGSTKLPRLYESVMMIVREGDERGLALHGSTEMRNDAESDPSFALQNLVVADERAEALVLLAAGRAPCQVGPQSGDLCVGVAPGEL
jgi:hypothetical protein